MNDDQISIRDFNKAKKKKQILKSLLTIVLLKKIKEELDSANPQTQTYHKPALIVFTGSVASTDSDLELFFELVREISLEQFTTQFLDNAKQELISELSSESQFTFQTEKLLFPDEIKAILQNIDKQDIFREIFNSTTKGEFVWSDVHEGDELLFRHKNSDKPFAIINIGEDGINEWKEKLEDWELEELTVVDEEKSWFEEASGDKNDVNIIMGSRKFYEGWDSVRPNVLLFVGIGTGNAEKYVLQSIGRGLRIKPLKDKDSRQRIKFLRNKESQAKEILDNTTIAQGTLSYLETLFITGTDREQLKKILDTVTESSKNVTTISLNKTTPTISQILIPKYKPGNNISLDELPHFDGDYSHIKRYLDWLDNDKAKLGNFSEYEGFDDNTLENLTEYILDASNFDPSGDLPSVEEQVKRLIKHIKVVPYEFDEFREIDDEINHFKEIKITEDDNTVPSEITKKIEDGIEASNISETDLELDELMEKQQISVEEYKRKLTLVNLQTQSHKEITIKHLENHYFTPIIYGDGTNKTSINPIISEESEKEFIDDLLGCINNPNSKLNDCTFDEWMFSRIQQNTDNVSIPYYDSQRNRMGKFYPDFIFWFKKDDQYFIVFIDPKGIAHSDYKRKSDGFNEIFDSNPYTHGQLEVTVKNWFYTKDKSQVPQSDKPLWKDSFEEILQDLPIN